MSRTSDRSHFGRAIYAARHHHELTQPQVGQACGLTHSAISRAESSPRRPDPPTLRALCRCWPDHATGIRVLIAHLEDEIARADRLPSEIVVHAADTAATDDGATRDLAAIRAHDPLAYDAVVRLISRIRALAADAAGRAATPADDTPAGYPVAPAASAQIAAEPRPKIGARTKNIEIPSKNALFGPQKKKMEKDEKKVDTQAARRENKPAPERPRRPELRPAHIQTPPENHKPGPPNGSNSRPTSKSDGNGRRGKSA